MTLVPPTRLEQLREAACLSVDELAERCHVSRGTIYAIEQRRVRQPHRRTLRRLAEFFEVEPADLAPADPPVPA